MSSCLDLSTFNLDIELFMLYDKFIYFSTTYENCRNEIIYMFFDLDNCVYLFDAAGRRTLTTCDDYLTYMG